MIGMNWKKSLVVAGAALAVAAAVPAMSQAHTAYTSKSPAPVAMMETSVKKVSTKKVLTHRKSVKKTSARLVHHKPAKKQTKVAAKKHTV